MKMTAALLGGLRHSENEKRSQPFLTFWSFLFFCLIMGGAGTIARGFDAPAPALVFVPQLPWFASEYYWQ
jgi:hypothetical protein